MGAESDAAETPLSRIMKGHGFARTSNI